LTPQEAYLQSTKKKKRIASLEKVISEDAQYSYLYAKNICNGPFEEGEKSIKKDPIHAWLYCKDVIRCRWYEAEDNIKKDPYASYIYCLEFMDGERWIEAEKTILKSPVWAGAYSEKIIKGRWKEAERSIAKDDDAAEDYYRFVIKGDWEGWSDDEISRSTTWMYFYAKSIGFMLPKKMHEDMLKRRGGDHYVDKYINEFCK
jgi:hypothetical protein